MSSGDVLHRILSRDELLPGQQRTICIEDQRIALFNINGTIYALDDRCADQGYSLGEFGIVEGDVVTCGFHFWTFDLRTGRSADDMEAKVRSFPVEVRGDGVYLKLVKDETYEV